MTTSRKPARPVSSNQPPTAPAATQELSLEQLAAVRGGANNVYGKPTKSKGGLD